MKLETLVLPLAVCRLGPGESVPSWALSSSFYSISKTSDELSIVCDENLVPQNLKCEKGWACLKVVGPLDFSLTGILASLAQPLAQAEISIFAISTFDTDYLLVKRENLNRAIKLLKSEGHDV